MRAEARPGWDLLPLLASVIAFGMMIVYLEVINDNGDDPAAWYLIALAVGALLAAYGSSRSAPGRVVVLVVSGLLLALLGFLGILTIGLPILIAGALAVIAAVRGRRDATTT
jgi:hypothetical protein